MGNYRNGRVFNAVSWVTVGVLVVLTGFYAVSLVR
jgi:hypothetical protein